MNFETSGIPNIQVANTGTAKNPLYSAKGFIELPSWSGYYLYDDTYKLKKNKTVTNGRIDLWIEHAVAPDGGYYIPQEQANSYFYLVGHEEHMKQLILKELKSEFPRLLRDEYASWDQDSPDFPALSELAAEFNFKNYIGPESIYIVEDVKDDQAYVTWRFRCRWDPEHGLEVITHKDRIIDIAPDSDIWKIYKDNGTYEQVQSEYKNPAKKAPLKKKWWQFW